MSRSCPRLSRSSKDKGFDVVVERGAGEHANLTDAEYEEAGATLGTATDAWAADAVLKVAPPGALRDSRPRASS